MTEYILRGKNITINHMQRFVSEILPSKYEF